MDVSVLEGMAVPESAKFIGFFAQETQLFFNAMKRAAGHFSETGSLPKSLFKGERLEHVGRGNGLWWDECEVLAPGCLDQSQDLCFMAQRRPAASDAPLTACREFLSSSSAAYGMQQRI